MTNDINLNNTTPQQEEEITLRCNRCGKPITPDTAVLTPTGYRCKECVRSQQKVFDTAKPLDPIVGFALSAVIAFAGAWISSLIGFFTLLLAPAVGTLISTVVRWAVKKRRSKLLYKVVLWGSILGSLPFVVIPLLSLLQGNFSGLISLVWRVAFTFLCATSAYYQISGIRLR